MAPLISICIPAYKNVLFLKRLLESISIQNYTNYEVVITDDSNDNSVSDYIQSVDWKFSITYHRNESVLGSPENWNAAVRIAKGEWIKIMHHDDWFSTSISLLIFAEQVEKWPHKNFFFCKYVNQYEDGRVYKQKITPRFIANEIFKNPVTLIANNIIGPPSSTIYRNNRNIIYDKRLKWLVDIDFYIRYLQPRQYFFIPKDLVNIGIHEDQVTKSSFRKPEIEIPEHLIILQKNGWHNLKNLLIYDAVWRLIRNLNIKSIVDIKKHNIYSTPIPRMFYNIIIHQQFVPRRLLSNGLISKVAMSISYLFNKNLHDK